jgi:hypothetical protein
MRKRKTKKRPMSLMLDMEEDDEGLAFENGDEETDEEVDEDDDDDEEIDEEDGELKTSLADLDIPSLDHSISSSSSSMEVDDGVIDGGITSAATTTSTSSQQSRNFGIVTALWASLVFDTILNKSKRAELFPSTMIAASSSSSTLVPTALLSSRFALAFGIAFLLWRDMENATDEGRSDDDDVGGRMGDWFLFEGGWDGAEEEVRASQASNRGRRASRGRGLWRVR